MSMRDVINSIEHEAFARAMNLPQDGFDGQAEVKTFPDGTRWIVCPWCGKRALKIQSDTKIESLMIKCRGSNCKKEFWVNI